MKKTAGLSLRELFAMGFGSLIGSGWLTVLGLWLVTAGPIGSVIAFAISCVLVMMVAFAYAELGSAYPVTGGEVAYSQFGFGSRASFTVGWMLVLVYIGYVCFLLVSVGWVFGVIFPDLRGPVLYQAFGEPIYSGEMLFGFIVAIFIVTINIRGAKLAARVQDILTFGLIIIGIAFALSAFMKGSSANLEPEIVYSESGWKYGGVMYAFGLILPFYTGFNVVSQAFGERASNVSAKATATVMLLSVIAAMVFYSTIIMSAASMLPREQLLALDLPTAGVIEVVFGISWLDEVVLFAGLIALITTWNGGVFAGARALYSLGELKLVPQIFKQVHPEYNTPIWGIILLSAVGGVLALGGRGFLVPILNFMTFAIALAWSLTSLSAWRIRKTEPNRERPIKVKYGPVIFIAGFIAPFIPVVTITMDSLASNGATIPSWFLVFILWSLCGAVIWHYMKNQRTSISEQERAQKLFDESL